VNYPENKFQVSIIIVNFNHFSYIKELINSIIQYNDIGYKLEVLIIDNSDEKILEAFVLGISLINISYYKSKNLGFGFANN